MATIHKFKILKMAYFLGLFGIFTGVILGIAAGILTLFIPILYDYAIWQMILGVTIANGVLMFITGLIFAPLINLSLKIIKGLHLDIDLASIPVKGLVSTTPAKKITSTTTSKKLAIKPLTTRPLKSAKDSRPLSQMTNVKTTTQRPASTTPVKPTPTTTIKPEI